LVVEKSNAQMTVLETFMVAVTPSLVSANANLVFLEITAAQIIVKVIVMDMVNV